MGKLLCEKKLRDVWCRNESVRAEIGQILHTDTRVNLSSSDIYIYNIDPISLFSFVIGTCYLTGQCLQFVTNPFSFEVGGVGIYVLALAIHAFAFSTLVILIDADVIRRAW